jgi:hypothetical protein
MGGGNRLVSVGVLELRGNRSSATRYALMCLRFVRRDGERFEPRLDYPNLRLA